MAENFYGALMMRRALPTTQNLKAVTAPGIYPVTVGNTTAPAALAGTLTVYPPSTAPKLIFIGSDSKTYEPTATGWQAKGTAAFKDVQTSPTDTTAGRLMAVGAFGLGKGTYTGAGDDEATVASRNLGWGVFRSHGAPDAPSAAYIQMMVMGDSANADAQRSLLAVDAANNGWLGSVSTAGAVKWSTIFTTTNKPTAADTNAVPLLANGVVNAINRIQNITSIFTPKTATPLELGQMSGVEGDFYLDIHTDGKEDGEDYSHRVTFIRGGGVDINSVSGGRVTIGGNGGEVVPSNYANFDAKYQAKGNYTPAGQAYTKAESDARYAAKGTSGSTTTGNTSAYYKHANGQIFMQCIGGIASSSNSNPDVTITLPASFASGILAVGASFSGSGGDDSDSWWTVATSGKNQLKLHTRNCSGTWSFVVTGY